MPAAIPGPKPPPRKPPPWRPSRASAGDVAAIATARQAAPIVANLFMTVSPDESRREQSNVSNVPVPAFIFDKRRIALTMSARRARRVATDRSLQGKDQEANF